MTKKLRVYSSVVLLGIVLAVVLYVVRVHTNDPIVFSEKKALSYVWNNYKKEYLEQGTGRPLDKQQNNITTSDGVS
jgi:endo-1,4-beta-D-glucanase Y